MNHSNGFEHVSNDEHKLGDTWDIGIKFEQREADAQVYSPAVQEMVWPEPRLIGYVTVRGNSGLLPLDMSIRFGMTRAEFEDGAIVAGPADKAELRRRIMLAMPAQIATIKSGSLPSAAKDIVFLKL